MNFVVYKSSAGSGKTHTLVKEYLKLVIGNPERFRNILAITFTNKAANEMKARILEYLEKLSHHSNEKKDAKMADLLKKLSEELHLTEPQISERAAASLGLILHNYSNFAVSTIDSFVHKLVRSFAYDLHLPLNFDVELDTEKLISKSIDLLISKVGNDKQLTTILVKFITTKMEDEKSWNIQRELAAFAKRLLDEDSVIAIKKLENLEVEAFSGMNAKLGEVIRNFENSLKQKGSEAIKLIRKSQIDPDSFYYGKTGIAGYFNRLANGNFDNPTPGSRVLTTIQENKWTASKCPSDDYSSIQVIAPVLTNIFQQIQDIIEKDFSNYNLCRLIALNIYPIAVLNEIQKVMDEFRTNENIVHISEFNKRIAAIVANEPAPYIYERMGEKYRHFLLDEFQDTSILQWQNLLPLLENSLSSNHFNMIVGDGKQSVYRWRSGEVEQFASLPLIYQRPEDQISLERENLLKSHYHEKVLEYNYRSGSEIVRFNNEFFLFARNRLSDDFRKIYDNVAQLPVKQNTGGMVHLEFISKPESKTDLLQLELERIGEIITNRLAGYPKRKIAVLTRSNEDGSNVAAYLLQNGINVLSSDALLISSNREVQFIIAFMRYLHKPQDKIALTGILQYLVETRQCSWSTLDEALNACANKELPTGSNQVLKLIFSNKNYNQDAQLTMLNLPDLVDNLIRIFNLNRGRKNPFVRFFQDLILDYVARYNDGFSDFLKYWDDKGINESIVVPQGIEAVNVMTIHKAKGLEFPVVIYPFAQNQSRPSLKSLWIDPKIETIPQLKAALVNVVKPLQNTVFKDVYNKEINKSFLDLINLLYVVMTRPTERLYILTHNKTTHKKDEKKGTTKTTWTEANPFPDAADLFYNYLMEKGEWLPEKSIYTFGQPDELKQTTLEFFEESIPETDQDFETAQWDKLLTLSRRAPKVWNVENPLHNRQWGNLVHSIMAGIITSDDIEPAVNRAIATGELDAGKKEALINTIRKVVDNPAIKPFFSEGVLVKNERDILLTDGSVLRPDRLVVATNQTAIIDYKTGAEEEAHKTQLQKYAHTLQQMNYPNIEKYLLYLDEGKVVKV